MTGTTSESAPQSDLRVLWSCVTEDRPDWHDRVTNLALSIRMFGGAHAQDPMVVNVVGSCDPSFESTLTAMDVEVRVVERFHPQSVYANKLRMLELHERGDFDVLLALDCDVLVVGDPSDHLTTTAVCVKPADVDALPPQRWARLLAALELPAPARSYVATTSGAAMFPYFNSGVVFLPHDYAAQLLKGWATMIDRILAVYEQHPQIVPERKRFYLDQYALALTLHEDRMGIRPLPVGCNLPLNLPTHPALHDQAADPVIVHYHKNRDAQGFMYASPVFGTLLNPRLDEFNLERARRFGGHYAGLRLPPLPKRARRKAVRYRTMLLDARDRFEQGRFDKSSVTKRGVTKRRVTKRSVTKAQG